MYTTIDKGKFLPHKFLNLVRILLLPKCCAPPDIHLVHNITAKANNFLFHFELNQVYNNIHSNIRCFTFSRMNFQKLFFDFMNCMKTKQIKTKRPYYWNSLIFYLKHLVTLMLSWCHLTICDRLLIIKPIH